MKTIKILIAAISIIAISGCANITLRPRLDYNEGPYFCTDKMNSLISRGFNGKPIEQMMLPVFFIDWPFDAVVDTLLLPYDYIAYSIRMSR